MPQQTASETRPDQNIELGTKPKRTVGAMNKRQKRLFSVIVGTLLEHGSLDAGKAGVVALSKEAKVDKAQLKALVDLAREQHPEINQVARVTKLIHILKKSGKKPSLSMFEHLKPEAQRAGKDDLWLSEKLGFLPSDLANAAPTEEKKNSKKSFFSLLKS